MKKVKIFTLIIATVLVLSAGIIQYSAASDVTFSAKIPESPTSLNIYRGEYLDNGSVDLMSDSEEGGNIPSESDAPEIAKNILMQYGGLPSDAEYRGANTVYLYKKSPSSEKFIKTDPLFTSLSWSRLLEEKPIMGDCDIIYFELGDNGEPLRIKKQWRSYTSVGNVSIIPVSLAISKIKNGDVISQLLGNVDGTDFYGITLGYYAKDVDTPEVTLEPIWIFYGNKSSDEYISLEVYARKFANFTATPLSGTVPLTVSFVDTSDASPTKWLWEFGDGTTSIEQSPTHTYSTAGIYNVSLKSWNDLGSDTVVRTNFVQARTISPPIANFTAMPLSGKVPLTVQFNDTSENTPTEWSWNFGDSKTSTEQNPIYTYTTAGNYTVNLTVTDADGSDTKTGIDLITVLPPTPPVVEFSANVTTGKSPLAVRFTDSSSNTPTAWEWSFGDGYVSTEQNPVHRYSVSGTYAVSLNATNADGTGNLTKSDYITVTKPGNAIELIDQLITYIHNQRNVPHIYQRFMIGELVDVKRSLNENRPGNAVMGMNFFKYTVKMFRPWPLTKDQASTMQNSADAIIRAIDVPVNQATIDQMKALSADVKSLHLSHPVEQQLTWNLESAEFMLESGKDDAAKTYLNFFIRSVKAQDGKKIPHDKASQLIAKAEAIKSLL